MTNNMMTNEEVMDRLDVIERGYRIIWALLVLGFIVGGWAAGLQWQSILINSRIDTLNKYGTDFGIQQVKIIQEANSKQDSILNQLQINQQILADDIKFLHQQIAERRNGK